MTDAVIELAPGLAVPEAALGFTHIRASGPGGQNVNKVATAVQLRFDVAAAGPFDPVVLARLRRIAGRRMTADGVIVITAQRFRSQEQNRRDALARLAAMLRAAYVPRKARRPTAPGRAARERRLKRKKRHGQTKRLRGAVSDEG